MANLNPSWGGLYFITPFDIKKHKLPVKVDAASRFRIRFDNIRVDGTDKSDVNYVWGLLIVKQKVWPINQALSALVKQLKTNTTRVSTNHEESHWFKMKPKVITKEINTFISIHKEKLVGFWTPNKIKMEPYLKLIHESSPIELEETTTTTTTTTTEEEESEESSEPKKKKQKKISVSKKEPAAPPKKVINVPPAPAGSSPFDESEVVSEIPSESVNSTQKKVNEIVNQYENRIENKYDMDKSYRPSPKKDFNEEYSVTETYSNE